MPNVVVGGVNATVLRDGGVDHEYEEYGGDRVRMDDGTLRVTVKGRKSIWHLVTAAFLSAGDAATLEAAIVGAPPVTCSGDALGASFSCAGVLHKKERQSIRGTVKYRIHFTLLEI
jgi:hypothetical protein